MRVSKFRLIPAVGLALCAYASGQQQAWYVDANAPANGDGTSWATAFQDLESAIDNAAVGLNGIMEVAVKEGTYSPNGSHEFMGFDTFLMDAYDVHVHGGFLGVSEDPHAPDGNFKDTVLTGGSDINHVFVVKGPVERVQITGFKIEGSVANGGFFPEDSGAAIYCESTVELFVEDMTFRDNMADEQGGAVYYANSGEFECRNSLFRGNVARLGGAFYMRFFTSMARFCNVVFRNNGTTAVTDYGGAMFIDHDTRVRASNCVFFDNAARKGGGVYHDPKGNLNSLDDHKYRHCTFAFNAAPGTSQGSEIHIDPGHPNGSFDFHNCIVYNPDAGPDIRVQGSPMATVNVEYSDVLESNPVFTGPGVISIDPLFKNPTNRNLRLKVSSPCKNTASNALRGPDFLDVDDDGSSSEKLPLDKDLENRLILNIVDMGAYEYRPSYIPPMR